MDADIHQSKLSDLMRSCGSDKKLASLKTRYLCITVMLGLGLVLFTLFSQYFVQKINQKTLVHIELRNDLISLTRSIRSQLEVNQGLLFKHMFSPDKPNLVTWKSAQNQIMNQINLLDQQQWANYPQLKDAKIQLIDAVTQLQSIGIILMQMRMDSTKQFPSVEVITEEMHPAYSNFESMMVIGLNSYMDAPKNINAHANLSLLREIKHKWDAMISLFRLYLANRMGSLFDIDANQQMVDVANHYKALQDTLDELSARAEKNRLNMQVAEIVPQLRQSAFDWFQGFVKVKAIDDAGLWRADLEIMNKVINPLLDRIDQQLDYFDQIIETANAHNVKSMSDAMSNVSHIIILMATMGLLSMFMGYIYIKKWIIKPMAVISSALRGETYRQQDCVSLPKPDTIECQELLSAFGEMQSRVINRESDLRHQAMHDALTGLPNRSLLKDRLTVALSAAKRENHGVALMLMDLNRFKEINDTLGHQAGDELLIEVSIRIESILRDSDTVARLGGDEFAILIPKTDRLTAVQLGEKILTVFDSPYYPDKNKVYASGSIGIAFAPEHAQDAINLTKFADVAMYQAKNSGGGLKCYDPARDDHSVQQLEMTNALTDAILKHSFDVYFQPKIDVKVGKVIGFECLARWEHEKYGQVTPAQFITIAEESGMIHQLTQHVLDSACHLLEWCNKLGYDMSVSVNVPTDCFREPFLLEHISRCMTEGTIGRNKLILEVTETDMMNDIEHTLEALNELTAMGVMISIDDFGTGFSSLSYLQRLPVNEIKIDQSFVTNMHTNEHDAIIVRSAIDMAHNLGLNTVAEGVEKSEELDLLAILGCDVAQGFFIGKPLPENQTKQWLKVRQMPILKAS